MPILWSWFVAENHFDSSLQFSVGANLISMHYFWINKSIGGKRSLYLLYSIIWWLVVSDFTHIALLFWSLWDFTLLLLHHWHCTSVLLHIKSQIWNSIIFFVYRYCNFKFLLWELRVGSNQDLGRGSFNQIWSILDSMKATNFNIL